MFTIHTHYHLSTFISPKCIAIKEQGCKFMAYKHARNKRKIFWWARWGSRGILALSNTLENKCVEHPAFVTSPRLGSSPKWPLQCSWNFISTQQDATANFKQNQADAHTLLQVIHVLCITLRVTTFKKKEGSKEETERITVLCCTSEH